MAGYTLVPAKTSMQVRSSPASSTMSTFTTNGLMPVMMIYFNTAVRPLHNQQFPFPNASFVINTLKSLQLCSARIISFCIWFCYYCPRGRGVDCDGDISSLKTCSMHLVPIYKSSGPAPIGTSNKNSVVCGDRGLPAALILPIPVMILPSGSLTPTKGHFLPSIETKDQSDTHVRVRFFFVVTGTITNT